MKINNFWTKFLFSLYIVLISSVFAQQFHLRNVNITDDYQDFLIHSNKLYRFLFEESNYTKQLSPIFTRGDKDANSSLPRFNVAINLNFLKMLDVDEEQQTFTCLSEFLVTWEDPRLAWNSSQFDGIDEIFVNALTVWQPEDNLYNGAKINEVYPPELKPVKITSSGRVSILKKQSVWAYCWLEGIGVFPFDHEMCTLYFMVYSYDYFDTSMSVTCNKFDFATFAGNSEWYAENLTCDLAFYNDANYILPYNSAEFNIFIRRQPHFYLFVIVLPCFILTLLSIAGLFFSKNRMETQLDKIMLALSSLMSIAVLLEIVGEAIPRNQTFPLLGIYVTICVSLIALGCAILLYMPLAKDQGLDKPSFKSFPQRMLAFLLRPNVILLTTFQSLNLINFIVFFSFWKK